MSGGAPSPSPLLPPEKFPFEKYVVDEYVHSLPDYDHEWTIIKYYMVATTILFIVVLPLVLKIIYQQRNQLDGSQQQQQQSEQPQQRKGSGKRAEQNGKKQDKKSKKRGGRGSNNKNDKEITTTTTTEGEMVAEVPGILLISLNVLFIIILFAFIATSPNNITTSRRVYQAPLLKLQECEMIIDMASRAAERNVQKAQKGLEDLEEKRRKEEESGNGKKTFSYNNIFYDEEEDEEEDEDEILKEGYEKLLKWPQGWKKDRHASYPTTDMSVVADFQNSDLHIISSLLSARLSPLLEKIYGITKSSIRANDMFVVRYDGDGQQALTPHTDSSHISFNILLNDGFVGGGTRFYHRLEQRFFDARPKPGDVLINNAMVRHEGLATTKGTCTKKKIEFVTACYYSYSSSTTHLFVPFVSFFFFFSSSKGTRYILVGFMNIDHVDPFTEQPTNVPYYSTYLSFPWLSVTLKQDLGNTVGSDEGAGGVLRLSHGQQAGLFVTAIRCTMYLGDQFAPHEIIKLVDDGEKAEEYISALDNYYESYGNYIEKSIWFKGQHLYMSLSGKVVDEVSEE